MQLTHYNNMRSQLESKGGYLKKVEMQELGLGNNGLIATDDIKVDELIGFFPSETFLSQTLVMESNLVK